MRLLCTVECPHDTSTVRACADLRTPPRASMHPMHPHASPADFTVQTLPTTLTGKVSTGEVSKLGRWHTGEGFCVCNSEFTKSAGLVLVG